jgi:hypothetical protein
MVRDMPTPVMHLALAERILAEDVLAPALRRQLRQQRGPFLLGHTAGDVQAVSGQSREETHFYTLSPGHPRPVRQPCRAAHEVMFATHPALAHAESLPPAHAAFIAGYIAHLELDELWLDQVFLPYFASGWASWPERSFLHNVLRTWLDHQNRRYVDGTVASSLRQAKPLGWLPFVSDEALRVWRDWLVAQLTPGERLQTAQVFAERMGVPVADVETVIQSPRQMEERVFSRIPKAKLRAFCNTGYARSVALIERYLGHAPM